jgi:LuxR family maltose regulon positive regulatory protein
MTSTPGAHLPMTVGKLTPPRIRPDAVRRARLDDLVADPPTPLTVVVAPAGWGKTTMLAQMAERTSHRPVAWMSLDHRDDDPARFWTLAAHALNRCRPGIGDAALAALAVPGLPPLDVAIPTVLNSLATDAGPCVLIVDDYQAIRNREIHEGVEFALTYLPPNVRVVIAARSDPALPLARLRARGQLTEIRAVDLAFTAAEATDLVTDVGGVELADAQVARLVHRTEGWAAGLHLAALDLRRAPDPSAKVAAIAGDDRHVLDYLNGEVLDALAEDERRFLLESSVLDRLCGDLCDTALARVGSSVLLDRAERSGLFLVALDDHREWYRFHQLFREGLRWELDRTAPERAADILERAATWWHDQGDVEASVRALLAAGRQRHAADLLAAAEDEFLDSGSAATFLTLADLLDETFAKNSPRLAIAMASAAGLSGRLERVDSLLDIAEARLDTDREPPRGWASARGAIGTLRVTFGRASDTAYVVAVARSAVAAEDDASQPGYVVARLALGLVLVGWGEEAEAVPVLEEAWQRSTTSSVSTFVSVLTAGVLATALLESDEVDRAQAVVDAASRAADGLEAALGNAAGGAVALLRTAEGRLAHKAGQAQPACHALERAARLARAAAHPSQTLRVLVALADARLATGDREAARGALDEAREIADNERVFPATLRLLVTCENRIGRGAARAARRRGGLAEELTDRELSILRALQGPLSRREIGQELFLSVNTIKGYTKSLYRKLGVVTRSEAVQRGRDLALI